MNEMELQTTLDPIEMDMGDPEIEYSPVYPNPEGDPTDDLTKVQIQGNIYKVKDPEVHEWARAENKPTYTKAEVGLGEVDNTSDLDKPISTATQNALDGKVDNSELGNYYTKSEVNYALDNKADKSDTYTKTETDNLLSEKADSSSVYTKTETDTALDNKVDKVSGKGLSTNDYDDTAKGIVEGVTSALDNKVDKDGDKVLSDNNYSDTDKSIVDGVTTALSDKVDKEEGKGLSSNDYTDTEKALVGTIEDKLDKTETAVNSNGLVIATPVTDTAPYIYRQTPVKESFKALMKKIVGASVVWNQILQNGNFADTSLWGKVFATLSVANNIATIEATDSGKEARIEKSWTGVSGHKYLCTATVKNDGVLNSSVVFYYNGTSSNVTQYYTSAHWITVSRVISQTTDSTSNLFRLRVVNSSAVGDTCYAKNCMIVDLTAMFGTTIADYVYTLETSQSGSGIAWLQSYGFFTEDYYAYKQNKLESGCVNAKKIYGKNLVFETLSSANITASGEIAENATNLYDLQIAEVKKGITYTASSGLYAFYVNRPQIGSVSYDGSRTVGSNKTFVAPITGYIAFRTDHNYATPQLEVGSAETSYVPYAEPTTYPISPITLRGLFKLSTDKLTVDGDEYNTDGSVTRKYGIVDLGSLNWNYNSTSLQFSVPFAQITQAPKIPSGTSVKANAICSKYITTSRDGASDKNICIASNGNIVVYDSTYTNKDTFKSAMSGEYFIYELETPTTEQTTPFTETEIVGSTEEFIDYEVAQSNRDVAIPVGTETDYYQEMKLPSLPTTSGNHNLIYNVATGFGWS